MVLKRQLRCMGSLVRLGHPVYSSWPVLVESLETGLLLPYVSTVLQ